MPGRCCNCTYTPQACDDLYLDAEGCLRVSADVALELVTDNSSSVALTGSGTAEDPLSAAAVVSGEADNQLSSDDSGLFVANRMGNIVDMLFGSVSVSVTTPDTTTAVTLTYPRPLATAPRYGLLLTDSTSVPQFIGSTTFDSQTATGATLYVRRSNTTGWTVYYQAIAFS